MRKLKAFTLVELLVVVAIIAVLATVIVIGFGSQKDKAAVATLKTNITSAISAATVCAADNGTVTTPTANSDVCTVTTGTSPVTADWPDLAETNSTWVYGTWATGTAAATLTGGACTNVGGGTGKLCAMGMASGSTAATAATATRAAVCPIGGGACLFYGTGM